MPPKRGRGADDAQEAAIIAELNGPKVKRYKFRTFAQRIADVDIDVHHKIHALELEQQRQAEAQKEARRVRGGGCAGTLCAWHT